MNRLTELGQNLDNVLMDVYKNKKIDSKCISTIDTVKKALTGMESMIPATTLWRVIDQFETLAELSKGDPGTKPAYHAYHSAANVLRKIIGDVKRVETKELQ